LTIIISCAGHSEFAERLNEFLLRSRRFSSASISIKNDEVTIENHLSDVKKIDVRRHLEGFLASSGDLAAYSIIEFNGIFTIGIMQPTEKLLRHACEMCGCIARTEYDLIIHKRLHAGYI